MNTVRINETCDRLHGRHYYEIYINWSLVSRAFSSVELEERKRKFLTFCGIKEWTEYYRYVEIDGKGREYKYENERTVRAA